MFQMVYFSWINYDIKSNSKHFLFLYFSCIFVNKENVIYFILVQYYIHILFKIALLLKIRNITNIKVLNFVLEIAINEVPTVGARLSEDRREHSSRQKVTQVRAWLIGVSFYTSSLTSRFQYSSADIKMLGFFFFFF